MYKQIRHRVFLTAMLFLTWASVAICEQPRQVTVSTVDGPQSVGELVDWSTDNLSLRDSDQLWEFPSKELLRIEFQSSEKGVASSEMSVELVDGSLFPISSYEVTDRNATVETPMSAESLTIPTEQIRLVEFPGASKSTQAWLPKWEKKEFTGDVLILSKKDSAEVDFLSGVINDISASQINFTWEGDTISVKRSKVSALTYYHAQSKDFSEPVCWLILNNGFRLPVAGMARDGEGLRVTTTLGLPLQVRFHEIKFADYSLGKLAYLSDLVPLLEKWTPLLKFPSADERVKLLGMPRHNTSFEGSPLTLSWPAEDDEGGIMVKTYSKGLALRGRTELKYRLPRDMRRFKAIAGIDPETLSQGNVLLTIVADGETLFERTIDGKQPPATIDLDIAQKKKLQILVDYGSNLDLGDRLHLVEARLVK